MIRVPARSTSIDAPIVHLGLGAFARAHLATYAQDLLDAGHDARIAAFSLRNPKVPRTLAAQGHRFTVVARDGLGDEAVRTVASIAGTGVGATAAVEAISGSACRLVTLTVTEAAYRPGVVVDVLAAALHRRGVDGLPPVVVAPLDNVASNGRILRELVRRRIEVTDPALADLADVAEFPSSVVDRIVPATPTDLSQHLAERYGIRDEVPVLTEPHRSWAIEAVAGLPPLDVAGVEVVDDVAGHERRKLWLLNGPHSAAALAGLQRGHDTIADAMADPAVAALVEAVAREALDVADLPASLDGAAFVVEVLERFRNPVLGHRCAQVATDSEHKLPLRIVPVVHARAALGLASPACATVLDLWPVRS